MFANPMVLAAVAAWLACAVWVIVWALLATRAESPAAGGAADPHAAELAAFRRELHDWDREGS